MVQMKLYHIRWEAWLDGARIKSHGEFDLPAASEEDARRACSLRWPEMEIIEIYILA